MTATFLGVLIRQLHALPLTSIISGVPNLGENSPFLLIDRATGNHNFLPVASIYYPLKRVLIPEAQLLAHQVDDVHH
jgi:hypothetical protein